MTVPKDMYFESEIRPEHNGRFLLDSLVERFTYHSKEEWIDRFYRGLISINGEPASVETIAHKGDKIVYHVENYSEPDVPTSYDTIFEDDEFILVAKPAGIPVHHTGRIFYNTFTAVIRRGFDCESATPMHRLDRDTGGLMLFAKYAETASRFQKNLDKILLRKFYLAVVRNHFPDDEIRCDIPLREDSHSKIRLKMYHFEDGKPCTTIFRKIAEKEFEGELFSIVECELITGRKHQIRAHLAELGFPIVGDKLYNFDGKFYEKMSSGQLLSNEDIKILGSRTQMLFAYKVELLLPYWKKSKFFICDNYPEEMKKIVSK